MAETILQHWLLSEYMLPFLLVFFILFAILEKTKVFGEDKKQLNALISFVVGLIFVAAVQPKIIVGNMVLFFTVALVVLFIGLLLWGFVSGGEAKIEGKILKVIFSVVVIVGVIIALLVVLGVQDNIFNFLFDQTWSKTLWTNIIFIAVIAGAIALAIKGK